jgi:DNA-3-methyladenine glycosylase II
MKATHKYAQHLAKDPSFKPLLATSVAELTVKKDIYMWLCASIMSQQLSTKVATVINNRFIDLFPSPTPSLEDILAVPFDTLKGIGLSTAKTNYVRNVAAYFHEHNITDQQLYVLSDEEVKALLLPIKGVGKWTVEMLLMFALGREDVFAVDDLGIQQAMTKIYGLDPSQKKAFKTEMERISAAWQPYRTYACLHLWKFKDA